MNPASRPSDEATLRRSARLALAKRFVPLSPVYVLAVGLIYLATPYPATNPEVLLAVLIASVLLSAGRLVLSLKFEAIEPRSPKLWSASFAVLTAAQGLVWGLFTATTLDRFDFGPTSVIVLLCVSGLAAASVVSMSPDWRVMSSFLLLLGAPIAVSAFQMESSPGAAVSALLVFFIAGLIVSGRRVSSEFWDATLATHRLEKEQRRHEVAMSRAREEARESARALSYVGREVRSPLGSILEFAQELDGTRLEPEQRERLHALIEVAESLQRTIVNLQDLSRLESGELALEEGPFDPGEIVESVTKALEGPAAAQGITLRIATPASLPGPVMGDASRLRQVLWSLVDASIRCGEGGEVEVGFEFSAPAFGRVGAPLEEPGRPRSDSELIEFTFFVREHGDGLAEALRLEWAEGGNRADEMSLDVGLRLACYLLKLMGGRVEIRPEPPDRSLTRIALNGRFARMDRFLPGAFLAGRHLVLAGEHELDRTVLAAQLRSWGARVTSMELRAPDGPLPDCDAVLLDADRALETAFEIAQSVAQQSRGAIPVLLLSAVQPPGGWPTRWVEKPTRLDPLRDAIREALGARATHSGAPAAAHSAGRPSDANHDGLARPAA